MPQVLTPQALADLSGAAAKCTAFAVYSKAQRQLQPDGAAEPMALEPGEAAPASLPFCSQPLLALASAAAAPGSQDVQQPAPCQQQPGGGPAGLRTLHCCYGRPPVGSSLLPLAFTDSCGELVHVELLDVAACQLGLGVAGSSSTDSLAAAVDACGSGKGGGSGTPAGLMCRLVLRRCNELLSSLRAASNPSNLLHSIAVASVGMQPAEREAWQQLLGRAALHPAELPAAAQVSVVELQALPPARRVPVPRLVCMCINACAAHPACWYHSHCPQQLCALCVPTCRFVGPNPPSGCRLLLEQTDSAQQQASIVWLPPPGGGSSTLLPQEHDTVRQLQVALVAQCWQAASLGGPESMPCSETDSLKHVAAELHSLAWLHAAFQGACLRTLAGGGQPALADAHLPLHAALAMQLQGLSEHACAIASGRE